MNCAQPDVLHEFENDTDDIPVLELIRDQGCSGNFGFGSVGSDTAGACGTEHGQR